jgi:putative membrane protein
MNIIKGFLIGIALVVPGLSGSIFAVVVGVYEPLLASINHFRSNPRQNLRLLVPIAIGVVIGILASTKLVLYLTEIYPILAYAFFTGLVLGVIPFVWKKMRQIPFKPVYVLLPLAGFSIIWLLAQLGESASTATVAIRQVNGFPDIAMLLFAGLFSVSLMAIPGISGSIMLMVINQYGTVYHAVSQLTDAAGLLLMEWLLKHFPAQVYFAVLGVVAAAIVILLDTGVLPPFATLPTNQWLIQIILAIVLTILGILSALFFDKPEEKVAEDVENM